jgi:hypothetical protein
MMCDAMYSVACCSIFRPSQLFLKKPKKRDPELGHLARELHAWLLDAFMRLFRLLQRDGHMDRALGDDDLAGIAINAYIIWFSWLGYVRTVTPDAPLDRVTGARGALQSFQVLAPHLEAAFAARARRILEQGAGMRQRTSRRAVRGG